MANRIVRSPLVYDKFYRTRRTKKRRHVMGAIMTSRQAAELDHSFERNGVTSYYAKKMSEGDFFAQALRLLLGDAELKTVERIVDCDADPIIPEGSILVRHIKDGFLNWKDFKMELIHGSDYERDDRKLDNEHLLPRYLIGKPVLNACVQQYLMRYFHLAPRNFHLYPPIVFWGTIYKNESGTLWVSCLDSTENGFREYSLRVNESMDFRQSAALKAI